MNAIQRWLFAAMLSLPPAAWGSLVIVVQPTDFLNTPVGASVTFDVTPQGNPPYSYRWQLNGISISGATNKTFTLTNVQPWQSGNYSVVVYDVDKKPNEDHGVISRQAALTVDIPFLNFSDNFVPSPLPVPGLISGSGRGDTTAASHEPGEPRHGRKKGSRSIWFNWRAPSNGVVTFDTRGSSFDTIIAAYTGTAVDALEPVSTEMDDDDDGGYLTSSIQFNVRTGITYRIAIDGINSQAGNVVLNWSLEPSEDPEDQVPVFLTIPKSRVVFAGDSISFLPQYSGPLNIVQQWLFNGLEFLLGQDELTIPDVQKHKVGKYSFRVHTGRGRSVTLPPIDVQISTDPINVARTNSALDKFSDAHEVVTNYRSRGPMLQSVRLPKATPATGYRGTQIFNTYGCNKEPGEPDHCGVRGGASSWYSYEATRAGILRINTEGSEFDTVVSVYADPMLTGEFVNLVELACDNNSGGDGRDSSLSLMATNGGLYYIAVDGVSGAAGVAVLNYDLGGLPSIFQHPSSQTVVAGSNVVFSVSADSTETISYQWRWNGSPLFGQTNSQLRLDQVQTNQAGQYQVVATTSSGSATSSPASLTVTLTNMQEPRITISMIGEGEVRPDPDLYNLLPGRTYRFLAVPRPGHLFSRWSGDTNSSSPHLIFRLESNTNLRAEFVPNPFLPFRGSYQGLFSPANGATHENSGFLSLALTDSGAFSGRAVVRGVSLPIRGRFALDGHADFLVNRGPSNLARVNLQLGAVAGQISGFVTHANGVVSTVWLDRSPFHARTNPAAARGLYTAVVSSSSSGAHGDGPILLTVDRAGNVRLSGSLSDGAIFTCGGRLSAGGEFPLYLGLYGNRGSSLGWLNFPTNNNGQPLTGQWLWFKPANSSAQIYPAGFSTDTELTGSRYLPPPPGQTALSLTNGQSWMIGGNLINGLTNPVTVLANHQLGISNAAASRLNLRITPSNGRLSGSFRHPQSQRTTTIRGAVLQNDRVMRGFFLGTNQSGSIRAQSTSVP